MKELDKSLAIMKKLLGPGGCPWDKKQTHRSLLKYLREESAEFSSAVFRKDYSNMKEELGDLLLQVIFHCAIAEKNRKFSFKDVAAELNRKLIRRHPHVFSSRKKISERQVLKQWEEIKKKERKCELKKNLRA